MRTTHAREQPAHPRPHSKVRRFAHAALLTAALALTMPLAACGRLGAEPTASPPPEYLCDVVPTKTLQEVMLLDPGQGNTAAYVHHHADFAPNSDWSEWFFSDSGDPVFWWRDRMGLCRE